MLFRCVFNVAFEMDNFFVILVLVKPWMQRLAISDSLRLKSFSLNRFNHSSYFCSRGYMITIRKGIALKKRTSKNLFPTLLLGKNWIPSSERGFSEAFSQDKTQVSGHCLPMRVPQSFLLTAFWKKILSRDLTRQRLVWLLRKASWNQLIIFHLGG